MTNPGKRLAVLRRQKISPGMNWVRLLNLDQRLQLRQYSSYISAFVDRVFSNFENILLQYCIETIVFPYYSIMQPVTTTPVHE